MQFILLMVLFHSLVFMSNSETINYQMKHTEILRKYYHHDLQIDDIVNAIINERSSDGPSNKHQTAFFKKICQNDPSYPYLIIQNQNQADPLEVLIACNIHAREFIASQICINFIQKLKILATEQPQSPLITHFRYRIFYRANNLRDTSFYQNTLIRTNANNVDLNRNYPTQFNTTLNQTNLSDDDSYGGPYPLSENFSQCLQSQVNLKKPIFILDIHSGEFAIYYQQQFKQIQEDFPEIKEASTFYQYQKNHPQVMPLLDSISTQLPIIKKIVESEGLCKECRITTLAKDNETINGHLFADMKIRHQIKYSILLETYSEDVDTDIEVRTEQQFYFMFFNPETIDKIDLIKRKWSDIIIKFLQEIYLNEKT